MITRGFGMMVDLATGRTRWWYIGADGIKRWNDNDEPVIESPIKGQDDERD